VTVNPPIVNRLLQSIDLRSRIWKISKFWYIQS